jgi:hypothetical protein
MKSIVLSGVSMCRLMMESEKISRFSGEFYVSVQQVGSLGAAEWKSVVFARVPAACRL